MRSDEKLTSACKECQGEIYWVPSVTGGWWAHENHPRERHNARGPLVIEQMDDHGDWHTIGLE